MEEQLRIQRMMDLIKDVNLKMLARLVKLYEPYDLTPSQMAILSSLKNSEREKVSVLGNKLNTSDSNISAICSRLEKRKLITRERDLNDQRIVYIKLTPVAKELVDQLCGEKQDRLEQLKNIKEEDMVTIINALEKLNEILDQSSKL